MDAGKHIGRCVCSIEAGDEFTEDIISGHDGRSQIQTIWPDPGKNQKKGHTEGHIKSKEIEILPPLLKKGEDNTNEGIDKPEIIWNNKIFTERDLVINWQSYDMIIDFSLLQ